MTPKRGQKVSPSVVDIQDEVNDPSEKNSWQKWGKELPPEVVHLFIVIANIFGV